MTNVLILGASGKIARLVADELKGQVNLTQFLRTPDKLKQPVGTVIEGNAANLDQLIDAMTDQDIVYSNLGPSSMAQLAIVVTRAAEQTGVKRLYWVATAGIYNEGDLTNRAQVEAAYGRPDDPNSYFGDERRGADIVDDSPLVTTVIRPHTLTNDDEVTKVKIATREEPLAGKPVSRKTVAHVISELILDPAKYQNESISIGQG